MDEDDLMEKEYQDQALLYINEIIKGVKVEEQPAAPQKGAKK